MSDGTEGARRDPIALLPKILVGTAGVLGMAAFFATSPLPRILTAAFAMILLAVAGAVHVFSLARLPDRRGSDPGAAEREPDA